MQEDEGGFGPFLYKGAELELELMKNIEKIKNMIKMRKLPYYARLPGCSGWQAARLRLKLYLKLTDDKAADDEQRMEAWISLSDVRFPREADEKAPVKCKESEIVSESEKSQTPWEYGESSEPAGRSEPLMCQKNGKNGKENPGAGR